MAFPCLKLFDGPLITPLAQHQATFTIWQTSHILSLSILPHWTLNANLTKLLDLLQGPSTYMPLCHWQCCPFYLKYSFYPTDLAHPSFLYLADAIKFSRQFPQPSYTYTHIYTNTPVYTSRSSHKHPWVSLHTSIPISTIQGIVTKCVHYYLSPLDMSNVLQQLAGTSGTLYVLSK